MPHFDFPNSVGRPKYLSFKDPFGTWRKFLTISLVTFGYPLLKNIDDLDKLIHCPEALQ
jgi:hypothetical protein